MRISDWSSDGCPSDLQWEEVTTNDWAITPMFLDVQYDRGRTDAMAETPMLSITEEREDGIVVRGWKAIGTAVPFANHILVGNLWRPGQTPDQTIYALVPIATPGVTVVARKSNAEPDRPEEHTSDLQPLMRIPYAVFCLK